jgi:methionyl aminopeptidase
VKIVVKNAREIEIMGESGRITASILRQVLAKAKPGVRGIELEDLAESLLEKFKARASFKTVGNYPYALCLSLNEEVVHGLPSKRRFKEGDLLSIDFGALHKGFHTDMARTILVRNQKPKTKNQKQEEVERFLNVGQEALKKAIKQAKVGNRVGHISQVIQETVEAAGYSVVKTLVGHGVGRKLHEDPQIPCFLKGRIEDTPQLLEGMTLAIEVMYAQGEGEVETKGWTIVTRDCSLTGHFENTIVVTEKGPLVLTK